MTQRAFKEALSDTLIATVINLPLNIGLVAIAHFYNMSVMQTSVFLTVVFFLVAVVRKTYTRIYFEKRNDRKKLEETT